MRRRALLATVGAAVPSLGGCLVFTGERPASELPDVEVEYRRGGALSPVSQTTLRAEESGLTRSVECRDDSSTTAADDLSAESYTELQRLVVRSAPASWSDRYDCEDTCADDIGTYWLQVSVDGTTHRTTIDPMANLPDDLERLLQRMQRLEDRFPSPDCDWD